MSKKCLQDRFGQAAANLVLMRSDSSARPGVANPGFDQSGHFPLSGIPSGFS